MKPILLLIFMIITSNSLDAQTRIDPPKFNRNFNDTTYYDRVYNHFIRGWNWGSGGRKWMML